MLPSARYGDGGGVQPSPLEGLGTFVDLLWASVQGTDATGVNS